MKSPIPIYAIRWKWTKTHLWLGALMIDASEVCACGFVRNDDDNRVISETTTGIDCKSCLRILAKIQTKDKR